MRKYILVPVLTYLAIVALYQYYTQSYTPPALPQEKQPGHIRKYIIQYKDIAIAEMQKYGIPASIKLAQGMLESNYGRSELAKNAHNHFGIKCRKDWEGNRYNTHSNEWISQKKRMEPRMSCFRAYPSAAESYRAHSLFLRQNSRYESLFVFAPTDYKAWAKGLQKAGYATDPDYANKLISIIQRYALYRFDGVDKNEIDLLELSNFGIPK